MQCNIDVVQNVSLLRSLPIAWYATRMTILPHCHGSYAGILGRVCTILFSRARRNTLYSFLTLRNAIIVVIGQNLLLHHS